MRNIYRNLDRFGDGLHWSAERGAEPRIWRIPRVESLLKRSVRTANPSSFPKKSCKRKIPPFLLQEERDCWLQKAVYALRSAIFSVNLRTPGMKPITAQMSESTPALVRL